VREAFQIEMPLRTLFDKPTIAELALVVEQALIEKIEEISDEDAERLLQTNRSLVAGGSLDVEQ
jgi:hypothetical protein